MKEFKGKLNKISPSALLRSGSKNENDELGAFFVTLGLIYNDLKDLLFFGTLIEQEYRKPNENELPNPHFGEYAGVQNHLNRLLVVNVHGFLEFLKKNNSVISKPSFLYLLKNLNSEDKKSWARLVQIIEGKKDSSEDFFSCIVQIRSNMASHYDLYGKVFPKYFKKVFHQNLENRKEYKYAFYSLGESMKNTRFYFSDAVAQNHMDELFRKFDSGMFKKTIEDMNIVLSKLIRAHIESRNPES